MRGIVLLGVVSTLVLNAGLKVPTAFESSFTQKITDENNKIIKYSGKLKVNSDENLKWNYSATNNVVCSSPNRFVMVEPNAEQVQIFKLHDSLDLAGILRNAVPVKASSKALKAFDYDDKLYQATYQDIHYFIGLDKNKHIDQIYYKDNFGNRVNFHFIGMRYLSKKHSAKVMECKYPSNYDVIFK